MSDSASEISNSRKVEPRVDVHEAPGYVSRGDLRRFSSALLPCPPAQWLVTSIGTWLEFEGVSSPGRAQMLADHILNNWQIVCTSSQTATQPGRLP